MKILNKITVVLLVTMFFSACTEKEKTVTIKGKVNGVDAKTLVLRKPNQDVRFDSLIRIPVKEGKFHYKMKLKYPEVVELSFEESIKKGAWRYMPLFLENEKINLTIYAEKDFDKNVIKGGKLNEEYKTFQNNLNSKFEKRFQELKPLKDSLDAMGKEFRAINKELKNLENKLKETKKQTIKKQINKLNEKKSNLLSIGRALGQKINKKEKPIYAEQRKIRIKYMESHPTLVSYYFLLNELKSYEYMEEKIDINLARSIFNKLKIEYPNHPYNEMTLNLIDAIDNIKVGKKFIDFSAPDLNGKKFTLSDEIKGKVALLDLWATWCGSCIRHTKAMVPVYNDYKDKGFTIIGVAGEFKNKNRLTKFLEKEKWEWLQLVELDRQNKIWNKYGINNSGGAMFLIGKDGTILAKNPTAKEVREELEKRLR